MRVRAVLSRSASTNSKNRTSPSSGQAGRPHHQSLRRRFKRPLRHQRPLPRPDRGIQAGQTFRPRTRHRRPDRRRQARHNSRDRLSGCLFTPSTATRAARRPRCSRARCAGLRRAGPRNRSYTFISTLGYVMDEAAKRNIQVIVLDRPNPLGGVRIEGPRLDPSFTPSFVGLYDIPYRLRPHARRTRPLDQRQVSRKNRAASPSSR